MMVKIFLLLFSLSAQAYLPSIESLFRNGSNKEVETEAAVLKIRVKKINELTGPELELEQEEPYIGYFTILFHQEEGRPISVTQAEYGKSDRKKGFSHKNRK